MTENAADRRLTINWREKLLAFSIHFLVTAALGAFAAALIFLVWFPSPFATMIGGTELFMLVVGCDIVLGPLLSLVIYDSRKSRRALIVDYGVVGVVQIATLVYGVYIVAGTRPVEIAFNKDRLEVVSARDISDDELAAARSPEYRSLSLTGPRLVAIDVPKEEQQDALLQSVVGNEEHQRPKFYAPYDSALDQIRKRAKTIEALEKKFPEYTPELEAAARESGIPPERLRWLPVHHRKGFWTALIDDGTGKPVGYAPVDPYGRG
jgi:hypothetical protein